MMDAYEALTERLIAGEITDEEYDSQLGKRRMLEAQGHSCYYCDVPLFGVYHVDHMTPISRGGSNWPENLCIACPTCNISKGAKTAEEFMAYGAPVPREES
jgi:5-methylcytosine-specific restriction endonuclease McrA